MVYKLKLVYVSISHAVLILTIPSD